MIRLNHSAFAYMPRYSMWFEWDHIFLRTSPTRHFLIDCFHFDTMGKETWLLIQVEVWKAASSYHTGYADISYPILDQLHIQKWNVSIRHIWWVWGISGFLSAFKTMRPESEDLIMRNMARSMSMYRDSKMWAWPRTICHSIIEWQLRSLFS